MGRTVWERPSPEQESGEWLVANDGHKFVLGAVQSEGDTFHVGWSVTMSGSELTLEDVEAMVTRGKRALAREFKRAGYVKTKGKK